MARKIREERTYKAGDQKEEIYVCWEDDETGARGFYEKGSPSDLDSKKESL